MQQSQGPGTGGPLPQAPGFPVLCVQSAIGEMSGMARAVRCGAWSLAVVGLICPSGIHSSACWASWALCRALGCR